MIQVDYVYLPFSGTVASWANTWLHAVQFLVDGLNWTRKIIGSFFFFMHFLLIAWLFTFIKNLRNLKLSWYIMIWINSFFSAAKNTKKEKIFNQNCSFPLKGLSEIYYLMTRGGGVEATVFILQELHRSSTPPILTYIFQIWHRF